ncbi:MAG: prolyl oligopeptidase family serine peptidase [Bacteroidetes bacterium]|nr:prolyl oligopeptidase family serine peptidase [Bacteroidota bacterium]MBU1678112.1 prolyl oligopeptidase family serine peptidase [Bacteroidota bacterium]MBU2506188.1 prolyl oligopeptidase family serine peptidase [Bacteroidota bacterium]
MIREFSFKTSDNELLSVTTFQPTENKNDILNVLVFAHGFKGFKDWGFGPYIGEYFSKRGFFVITFNFSHNGIGGNKFEFTELDKFADNTISREVRELIEISNAVKSGYFGELDEAKIGLLGHSRGGVVSILAASKSKILSAITTWASIFNLNRFSERQIHEWKERGFVEIMNARTKQKMKLNLALLNDIEQNSNDYLNVEKAIIELKIPLLIAHGKEDLAVSVSEAEMIYESSDKNLSRMILINGAGHTFNVQHPFSGSNPKFENLLEETHKFFVNSFAK